MSTYKFSKIHSTVCLAKFFACLSAVIHKTTFGPECYGCNFGQHRNLLKHMYSYQQFLNYRLQYCMCFSCAFCLYMIDPIKVGSFHILLKHIWAYLHFWYDMIYIFFTNIYEFGNQELSYGTYRRDDVWFAALGRSCIHMTWNDRGAISLEVSYFFYICSLPLSCNIYTPLFFYDCMFVHTFCFLDLQDDFI